MLEAPSLCTMWRFGKRTDAESSVTSWAYNVRGDGSRYGVNGWPESPNQQAEPEAEIIPMQSILCRPLQAEEDTCRSQYDRPPRSWFP